MKVKLLIGLVALLAIAAGVFLLVRQPGRSAGSGNEPGTTRSIQVSVGSEPGAASSSVGGSGSGGARGSGQLAGAATSDSGSGSKVDSGEPHSPPYAAKLGAEALVRRRDLIKTQLAAAKEQVPKLKAVLERLRKSSEATPQAIEQVQTQLQQTVDAVTRLERALPELEAKVAKLPGAKPEAKTKTETEKAPHEP